MFSASQIETAEACPRKWAWRKLDGIDGPPGPSAQLGLAVHKAIERYLKFGEPPDMRTEVGKIAMAGYHLWPGEPREVERAFRIELGGHTFIGYQDIATPGAVWDHKTTGDLRYAKTPDELESNIQATLYAYEAMGAPPLEAVDDGTAIDLHWLYYRTRKPYKAHPVRARVSLPMIAPRLMRTIETADTLAIILAHGGLRALDLPPDVNECERYGGCAYRGLCNLTDEQKIGAIMSNANEMMQRLAQQIQPGPVANGAPAPAVAQGAPATPTDPCPPGWQWILRPGQVKWEMAPKGYDVEPGTKVHDPSAPPAPERPPLPAGWTYNASGVPVQAEAPAPVVAPSPAPEPAPEPAPAAEPAGKRARKAKTGASGATSEARARFVAACTAAAEALADMLAGE